MRLAIICAACSVIGMSQAGTARRPSIKTERAFAGSADAIVAGVDEAGRGPWAGPVVAAAVIFRSPKIPKGLDNSKRLTAERRAELYDVICERAWFGVSIVSVEEIDSINILQASMQAMARAVATLNAAPDVVLVDGNICPKVTPRSVAVIEGDRLCPSIAAASIIAKVTRDRLMQNLAGDFPAYSWHTNKGYGTRAHAEAIDAFGVTCHHRRSFAPIRIALDGGSASCKVPE